LITLLPDETLKIAFTVFDAEIGENVRPHQTFLRFYDSKTGEEGIQPIKVSAQAKGRFELVGTALSLKICWF